MTTIENLLKNYHDMKNENIYLKLKLGEMMNEKKIEKQEEKMKYIAYPNIPVLATRIQGITCDIQFLGNTLIEDKEIKLYLDYHEKDKNIPIDNLSIFNRVQLFYGNVSIADRKFLLGDVKKGDKDYYLLSDMFPGIILHVNNTFDKHLILRFNVNHKHDYRITKFECKYSQENMNDDEFIYGFKDLVSMTNSYYNDCCLYNFKVYLCDLRDSDKDCSDDFEYKVKTSWDYYVNNKFIEHIDDMKDEIKRKNKHAHDKGLHYYKFNDDKIYLLYVQQIYQIRLD